MIEIVSEPLDHCIRGGLIMDPERHVIVPDGEWIRTARRFTGFDDLFVYQHEVTDMSVLCRWIVPPWRDMKIVVCQELENWKGLPDWFHSKRPTMEFLKHRLMPAEDMLRLFQNVRKEQRREELVARKESEDEAKDMGAHLHRRGNEVLGAVVASEPHLWVGEREGGEALEQVREELGRLKT